MYYAFAKIPRFTSRPYYFVTSNLSQGVEVLFIIYSWKIGRKSPTLQSLYEIK